MNIKYSILIYSILFSIVFIELVYSRIIIQAITSANVDTTAFLTKKQDCEMLCTTLSLNTSQQFLIL